MSAQQIELDHAMRTWLDLASILPVAFILRDAAINQSHRVVEMRLLLLNVDLDSYGPSDRERAHCR